MGDGGIIKEDGGKGSGNFGHEGRPGQRGGSGAGGSKAPAHEYSYIKTKFHSTSAKQYHDDIAAAKASQKPEKRWRVDVHDPEDYESCKTFTSSGGSTAAVTPDGDIISVCKFRGDNEINGKDVLKMAVENGGTKLDSFSGNHQFYQQCGFTPVSWTPFNKDYAPDGWAESGQSEEMVVFYKYTGENTKRVSTNYIKNHVKHFEGEDGYDQAMAFRDNHMGESSENEDI